MTKKMTQTKKQGAPKFRVWLDEQGLTVPKFVEEAIKRGVITAKVNSLYKAARGAVPRNRALYERAFPGIRF